MHINSLHQPALQDNPIIHPPNLPSNLFQGEPCSNPACLEHRRSLEQEIKNLRQTILSLQKHASSSEYQIINQQASSDPFNHHLNELNLSLASTLTKEREQFELERKSWISFKRDYATRVVDKLNELTSKFVENPKLQSSKSSLHPLITLALEPHEQQKQKISEFFQTRSHLSHSEAAQYNDKPDPQKNSSDLLNHSKSAVDEPSNQRLVSPNHNQALPSGSPCREIRYLPPSSVSQTTDLAQQSTSQSFNLIKTTKSPQLEPSIQVPTHVLYDNDKAQTRGPKTPVKEFHHSFLGKRPLSANSPESYYNKLTSARNAISENRNPVSPSRDAHSSMRNANSPRRNAISPRRNATSPRRNAHSPRRNATSPRRNATSPRRNAISPRRNATSPRKNKISPGRNRNSTTTRPGQLSLRLKPQTNERANHHKNVTPQLSRKRSVSSLASGPALPTPKWIRYSDRKARTSEVIWNDLEDKVINRTKIKKSEPLPVKTLDDFFQIKQQDPSSKSNEISKPVQFSKKLDIVPLGPSSEGLSTTEESDTESVSTPVQKRVSSIVNSSDAQEMHQHIATSNEKNVRRRHKECSLKGDFNPEESLTEEQQTKNNMREKQENHDDSNENIHDQFEINPQNNFGVGHVFEQVGRGKHTRKNMHARDCQCCSGYYEQAAKDLNQFNNQHQGDSSKIIREHQHQISRHRHFHPPPLTPPSYWQMGFPDTQEVENINERAEKNKKIQLKNMQIQARDGTGPYKFKDNQKT